MDIAIGIILVFVALAFAYYGKRLAPGGGQLLSSIEPKEHFRFVKRTARATLSVAVAAECAWMANHLFSKEIHAGYFPSLISFVLGVLGATALGAAILFLCGALRRQKQSRADT